MNTMTIGFWPKAKSQSWAHTSLHRVLGMPTTAFTLATAASLITAPWYTSFAGEGWKRFLSRVSLMDTFCGLDLMRAAASTARK